MSSTTDTEQRFAYLLSPEFEIVNTAGKPLTGGWIEVYIHGTRDKYYCLSDFDGTLHPFQIPLDSLGSNIVLASPTHAYDIYIYNKFGSLVMSRYNVVPATNSPDAVADVVVIDSPDETINVTIDGGSNWHLEVNTDLIATASGLAEVSGALTEVSGALLNKKDKQEALSFEGAATKTVKNISQDDNGVITVEYEDIDLPQQVPNVNIISPSGTLDITSTTDPATNTKTFKIDVHKSNMDYFEGYYGKSHYEDRPNETSNPLTCYVDKWQEYKYQGDFIANSWQDENNINFILNSGLYLIHAEIAYDMHNTWSDPEHPDPSKSNDDEYMRIYTGAFNGLENGTRYKDWSHEYQLSDNTIQMTFIRNVDDDEDYQYLNNNHYLYFAPELPFGANYVCIRHLQIVKLDSIVSYHGGPGPSYKPGYGIEILDDVISVATGDVITNNYFETVVSSINNEINELTTVINNVSGDITNLSESVTNLIGATGDYATKDYVDEAVSGLENYSAGQYISIEDHVINVTGVQPAGDYATVEQLEAVSGDVNNLTEIVNNITNVTGDFATVEYVDNRIATAAGDVYEAGQYVSIVDNTISVTGLQPAGDYATEQYVDEAVAAVTGSFEQQQSDWTQTDDTKVDYIKHKPRQVNLVAGDNITIEQDGLDVIISASDSGDTYTAGQYISIQNGTIAATGLQPAGNYLTPADLNGYATEQYVDDAVAAVTGQPFEQVNSDWLATSGVAEILNKPDVFQLIAGDNIDITPSGNDLVISAESDVTKAYVDEQIDAVSAAIPEAQVNADWLATSGKAEILNKPQEEAVEFEEVNLSDYALASAIPDVSSFVTQQDIDDTVVPIQSQIDTLAAATGDYATEQYVDDAIATVTDLIPQDTVTHVELADAIDSATALIPDVSNFVTQQDINDSIAPVQSQIDTLAAATGNYLTEQVNADWNATSGVSEILNKPESEEVQFEEVNLSDYALASAIPSLDGYATEQYVDEHIAVVTGIIPSDVVTEQELADAIDAATGLIPDVSNFVTQQDIDDSIAPVQTEIDDLVAATGNYLTEQVQSDWTEIDDEDPAYILNKPAETELIAGTNITITDVGSGIVISASGGSAEDDEFYAIYDVTTLAEVNAAAAAGKKLFAKSGDMILLCDNRSSTYATFIAVDYNAGPEITTATVTSNGWTISTDSLQADWAETNTSKASYIHNKPAIPNYTAGTGIDITNDTISLDDPVNLVAGDNVTITTSGDNIVISAQGGGGGGSSYTAGDNINITDNTISVTGTEDLTLMPIIGVNGIDITNNNGVITFSGSGSGVTKTLLYTGSSSDARSGTFTLSQSGYNFDRLEMTLIDVNNFVIKQIAEMPADGLVNSNGTRGSSFNSITSGAQTWFKAMNWQLNSAGTTLTYWVDEIATSGNSITAINRNQTGNRPIMLRIYGIKE